MLVISGGNTYELLNDLRKTGLDKAIIEFSKKDEFVLSGFSAGACVLTPTIAIAGQGTGADVNEVDLKDLTGLNIVDFEVYPHYENGDEETYEEYSKQSPNKVKKITDQEFIKLDL